jgi:hypothetical protein
MSEKPRNRAEVMAHLLQVAFPQVASWMKLHPRVKIELAVPQPADSQLVAFQVYASKLRSMSDGELFVEKQLNEAAAMATKAHPEGPDLADWRVKGLGGDERSYWAKTLAEWDQVEQEFWDSETRKSQADDAPKSPEDELESELAEALRRIRELEDRNQREQAQAHESHLDARRRIEDLQVALTESIGGLARLEEQRDKERKASAAAKAGTMHPKLRTTFEKLILGMAMDKFKYQPGQVGSAAENIRGALLRAGIKLDVKTIRERLAEAARKFEEEAWG